MSKACRRVVICGAAGRDFHNFNVAFRDDPGVEVVAFTAAQIPGIDQRRYPPELAGPRYPDGIPIVAEAELESLCRQQSVSEVVFAYSDVSYTSVMEVAVRVLAAGPGFRLLGPDETMLKADVPVIAVCAVRTGCGKSQTARFLSGELVKGGRRVAVVRHPMPYGNIAAQRVQRFASMADMDAAGCTLEEREEYEPHVAAGGVVYAGADYRAILERAERDVDVLVWDGGNNDFSFMRPDFHIVVVDALRPNQLDTHYPGAAVLRTADLVVVNKIRSATTEQLEQVNSGLDRIVPGVPRVLAASPVVLDHSERLAGARVLVVEDGPTITHGGMPTGAGYEAVRNLPLAEVIDPRTCATGSIAALYESYPHIGPVLPAMGYGSAQLEELRATVARSGADFVVAGTPIDLARALETDIPVLRARYAYHDAGSPGLMDHVEKFLRQMLNGRR